MATQVSSSLSEKQAQGHRFWFNSKSRTKTEIFQLVEYVVWNHEVVGSSPAFCTKVRWCNGNITDCRSVVTGSIPVRTAKWLVAQRIDAPVF